MKREDRRAGAFTRRALLLGAGQLGIFGALAAKLYQVQVVEGARYATLSDNNRISARLIAPPRGRVLDRHGAVVAGNRLNWRALLVAEQAGDAGAVLDIFSQVLPLAEHERARLDRELRRRRRFIPLVVREFLSWEDMARIEVNAPDLPGILIDVGTTRFYPYGPGLAHVIGYVAKTKLGCNVTYPDVKEEVGWQGMASGSIDTIVENWGHADLVKKYIDEQKSVQDAGPTGGEGLIGWFVPQWMTEKYPDITDYKNLNKYADLFKTSESGDKGQLPPARGSPFCRSGSAAL